MIPWISYSPHQLKFILRSALLSIPHFKHFQGKPITGKQKWNIIKFSTHITICWKNNSPTLNEYESLNSIYYVCNAVFFKLCSSKPSTEVLQCKEDEQAEFKIPDQNSIKATLLSSVLNIRVLLFGEKALLL